MINFDTLTIKNVVDNIIIENYSYHKRYDLKIKKF